MVINTFKFLILIFAFLLFGLATIPQPAYAIYDPLSVPNNKFGIHIISPSQDESSPAADLVNSSGGDWGYVTILIQKNDMKKDKWQTFFDDLRRRHLIPLVRIATEPQGNFWKVPEEQDAQKWAEFLNSLNWPTKNRYIIIYNEPNHGQEWGGKVDPASYAQVLNQTIDALKAKNEDFFILNAGLDASTPQKPPAYQEQQSYMAQMEEAVPGIFNKLDGWASHSYPNPGFAGSPKDLGQGTVRTWIWEQQILRSLKVNRDLPIFITETGWKHSSGKAYEKSLPTPETVGQYLEEAFNNAWNSLKIVAVTPFLLDYQDYPFDHFSFKKLTGEQQNAKILGIQSPEYYPHYYTVLNMGKNSGKPVQENKAQMVKGEIFSSVVSGESYIIPLTFKNTGQSIWGDREPITLKIVTGEKDLGLKPITLDPSKKIEPGQEAAFQLNLNAPKSGKYKLGLQLYQGDKQFDQLPLFFEVEAKSPVILWITGGLKHKKVSAGTYNLAINSQIFQHLLSVDLAKNGMSEPIEARYLIPDYNFTFTLSKPFYKPKSIDLKTRSGINYLSFGELEPDYASALSKPKELWKLLPFSN